MVAGKREGLLKKSYLDFKLNFLGVVVVATVY